jgi:hypothetical protein
MKSEPVNPVRIPPGPKGHFLLGTFADYSRDPLGYLSYCAKEYGDIVYFPSVKLRGINPIFSTTPITLRKCWGQGATNSVNIAWVLVLLGGFWAMV